MAERVGLLVLGMHRTGTSATAGWLQTLGVNLGPYLMAEDPTQPKGYFEHAEIVAIHDELMAAFGSSWDDARALPEQWHHDARVRRFRGQLMAIIDRDLMKTSLWAAKDPRLCRLLPLWLEMLAELGVSARAICVLRHPTEVAESLAARNGFAADKSGLLWLRYMLEAERYSRRIPRVMLRYRDLLSDAPREAQRVAQALDFAWPTPPHEAMPAVSGFLDNSLRHYHSVSCGVFPAPLRKWIVSCYRALSSAGGPDVGERKARLDSVRRELMPYDTYAAACWIERTRNAEVQNVRLRADAEIAQATLARMQCELEELKRANEAGGTRLLSVEQRAARIRTELEAARKELAFSENARAELSRRTAALEAASSEAQRALVDLRTDLTLTAAQLVQTRAQLAEAERLRDEARSAADSARKELQSVYRSRFWRCTRPWRALDGYLRDRRHRRKRRGNRSANE